MTEPVIICPQCSASIPLTESLAAPLIKATRLKYEQAMAAKDRAIAEREASIRERAELLESERAQFEEQIAVRIEVERHRISAEEAVKASRLAATDLEAKARELAELQEVLRQRDEKLAEAQKAQAEFIRKQRALEDERRELELTVERRVQAQVAAAQQKARLEAEEPLKLRVLEKEEQIASMQRQIEELKRKAEQGSQQLQGEVLELELEAMLRSKFPRDIVEPVPKGEFGGDILQQVIGPYDQVCGKILWESKRTRNWSHGWLTKLREDQRRAKADAALIVTNALPKGVRGFDLLDGVWVAEPLSAFPLALAIRVMLVEVAGARQAKEGQQTKMEMVYDYLTGPYFRQRVGAIVEKIEEMQSDLEKERSAMTKIWAKREIQIRGVIEATAGMYGDLQGIAGKALEKIDHFDLQLIGGPEAGNA
jgi:hypothetical protein